MRILCVAVLATSCEWLADPMSYTREEVPRYKSYADHQPPMNSPRELRVMAWNVKYAACRVDFWFDFWGERAQLSTSEVNDCLTRIAALIREYNPDILMTEEIEVGSRRSAYVDMVRFLLENTDLRYAAYASIWDTRYIPGEGMGRINMGNAIHSRYPIVKAERIRQIDRGELSEIELAFYTRRAVGRAEIDLGDSRRVAVYAVHVEPFDRDGTKKKHLEQLHSLALKEELPWVMGGDFNELPPVCDERADAGTPESCEGRLRLVRFPDMRASSEGSKFIEPPYSPSLMKPLYDDLSPHISLARYGVGELAQQAYFTHSVLGPDGKNDEGVAGRWNRTLDYLFVRKSDGWRDTDVLQGPGRLGLTQDAIRLSDHAPVVGTWELR